MFELFYDRRRRARAEAMERRGSPRSRVLLSGKIVYGAGYTADCAIRDLSKTGARVALQPHQPSPDEFYLIVVRDGVTHRSRTLWSADGHAGVSFEESHRLTDSAPTHVQPVRRLWAELAPRP